MILKCGFSVFTGIFIALRGNNKVINEKLKQVTIIAYRSYKSLYITLSSSFVCHLQSQFKQELRAVVLPLTE
jgi:hypothetical protein